MSRKEWTEKERYDLAKDVHFVSEILYLTDLDNDDFEWEYYQDRLEQAMELISPKYVADYEQKLEEAMEEAMNDPVIDAIVKEIRKHPETKETVEEDMASFLFGEITLDEFRGKWSPEAIQKKNQHAGKSGKVVDLEKWKKENGVI